jgi:hypothetical protein
MEQAVQILGALLVLVAFALSQRRLVDAESLRYLVPNLVGSAALAADAYAGGQWGFVLLEGAWSLVSALGVIARIGQRGFRRAKQPGPEARASSR